MEADVAAVAASTMALFFASMASCTIGTLTAQSPSGETLGVDIAKEFLVIHYCIHLYVCTWGTGTLQDDKYSSSLSSLHTNMKVERRHKYHTRGFITYLAVKDRKNILSLKRTH